MAIENNPKTIKIKELPEISTINDTDIFIIEDLKTTHKITGANLIKYIRNHTQIDNYFAHQEDINSANGIAPLDANKKVPSANINFGTTSGTVYEGSRGKTVETNIDNHLTDSDAHGHTTLINGLKAALNSEIARAKGVEATKVGKVSGKGLSTNDYTTAEKNKLAGITEGANKYTHPSTHTASMIVQDSTHRFVSDAEKTTWNDKYTKNEVDNKFSTLETNIDWKESVATYSDIAKTYPNPVDGWTVNVKDTDYTYRYSGTAWVAISANAIPKATTSVDGLLSKENKVNYDDAYSKRHTHSNKSVIDGITSALIAAWNASKIHADSAHAPSNAEKNIIVGIQKNGTDISPNSSTRKVNITVPTKISELKNDSGYKTTDKDTTYKLTKLGSTITLTGSDGTTYDVEGGSGSGSYVLPTASSSLLGGIKTGYTASGKNYPVAVDPDGDAYVNVPWTNTTYDLSSFGITATATELNYTDGVTSNIQTQLNGKAASSHGTHVTFTTTKPKVAGTAAVGTATTVSRSDHVHPAQTSVERATKDANGNVITSTYATKAEIKNVSKELRVSTEPTTQSSGEYWLQEY